MVPHHACVGVAESDGELTYAAFHPGESVHRGAPSTHRGAPSTPHAVPPEQAQHAMEAAKRAPLPATPTREQNFVRFSPLSPSEHCICCSAGVPACPTEKPLATFAIAKNVHVAVASAARRWPWARPGIMRLQWRPPGRRGPQMGPAGGSLVHAKSPRAASQIMQCISVYYHRDALPTCHELRVLLQKFFFF